MARRRTAVDDSVGIEIPEELRHCYVEDWAEYGEGSDLSARGVDPGESREWARYFRAHRRWKTARDEWAEEHGIPWREMSSRYPTGRPRWRGTPR